MTSGGQTLQKSEDGPYQPLALDSCPQGPGTDGVTDRPTASSKDCS